MTLLASCKVMVLHDDTGLNEDYFDLSVVHYYTGGCEGNYRRVLSLAGEGKGRNWWVEKAYLRKVSSGTQSTYQEFITCHE